MWGQEEDTLCSSSMSMLMWPVPAIHYEQRKLNWGPLCKVRAGQWVCRADQGLTGMLCSQSLVEESCSAEARLSLVEAACGLLAVTLAVLA